MTGSNGSAAKHQSRKRLLWFLTLILAATAAGCGFLVASGSHFWLVLAVCTFLVLPLAFLSERYGRRVPARVALVEAFASTVICVGFFGFMQLGLSARHGWIQTVVEIGGGAYLLYDLATWRKRRSTAGMLLVRVPAPWWFVSGFACFALFGFMIYFTLDFPSHLSLFAGFGGVLILVGTLETFFEAAAGAELRHGGVLFFSSLISWRQIRRWEIEGSRLYLYLRRYPPIARLVLGGNIGEKRVAVFLRSDVDREQLETVLRQRAFVGDGEAVTVAP